MDSSIIELLTKITLYDLIVTVLLIIAITAGLITQKKRISKLLDRWRKTKNNEEDFNNLVYSLRDSVIELKSTMEQYQINREHDRNDSIRIREEMYEVIDRQSNGIKELKDIITNMEIRNSKTKRAEIKEKIERLYSECHPNMTCTEMAFETLQDLIEEYEEHGGKNSFVHSIVEPEMLTWNKINNI